MSEVHLRRPGRVVVCVLVAFASGSAAAIAAPSAWRVVARDTGTGEFAVAVTGANVNKPEAVAFRVLGGASPDVQWSISCTGSIKNAKANRVYALTPRSCRTTAA